MSDTDSEGPSESRDSSNTSTDRFDPCVTRRQLVFGGLASAALAGADGCGQVLPARSPDSRSDYDVCVIGSGFAGIPLALRMANKRLRTVVLEAASQLSDGQGPTGPFSFENSGEISYPVNSTRMIALGGTSNHWTGIVNRLRPSDFRVRSEFGMTVDWPLDYDELEPYYCEAEQALSVRGWAPIEAAEPPRTCQYPILLEEPFRGPKIQFEGRQLQFFRVARSTRVGGSVRMAEEEVPRFADSAYGTLLTGHQVTRLVTLDGRTIDHVIVRFADDSTRKIKAKRFVVAAGVVESPRLLLMSRSESHPRGLGNNHDLLGRMFVEHPTFSVNCEGRDIGSPNNGWYRSHDFSDPARQQGMNAYHYQMRVRGTGVRWMLQPEMESRRENRVTLSESRKDRFGDPIPNVHFGYSARDQRTIEHAQVFFEQQALLMGTEPEIKKRRQQWLAHPSGTCRMGFDEKSGVVDRNNRVMGMENLYVSGACVFPTSGTANPTLTVVAMTLRLGDHLIAAG